jgi:hypothetical protein
MKTRLFLLAAFLSILSACTFPVSPPPAEATSPANGTPEQDPPSAGAKSAVEKMVTYTDELAGFSLDYPAGWFVESSALANAEESFAYAISIASWDLRNPPTPDGKDLNTIADGLTKIDVAVTRQAKTLEEAIAQQEENENDRPILAREEVTLAGGLPGVILDAEGFTGLTRTLITVLNGNVIYVSGYGNLESFEAIALTLRAR